MCLFFSALAHWEVASFEHSHVPSGLARAEKYEGCTHDACFRRVFGHCVVPRSVRDRFHFTLFVTEMCTPPVCDVRAPHCWERLRQCGRNTRFFSSLLRKRGVNELRNEPLATLRSITTRDTKQLHFFFLFPAAQRVRWQYHRFSIYHSIFLY